VGVTSQYRRPRVLLLQHDRLRDTSLHSRKLYARLGVATLAEGLRAAEARGSCNRSSARGLRSRLGGMCLDRKVP
jgi:hypothetical protein